MIISSYCWLTIIPSCCRTVWSPPPRRLCSQSLSNASVSVSPSPSPDGAWPAGHNINSPVNTNQHLLHALNPAEQALYAYWCICKISLSHRPIKHFVVIIIMYADCEYWQFLHTDTSAEFTWISILRMTGENCAHGECASFQEIIH